MKEHMFLNKIDFSIPVSSIPNNDAGNLRLYRLLTLVRESYELKSLDETVGYPEPLEIQASYYNDIKRVLDERGLKIPIHNKSRIERVPVNTIKNVKATLFCPICGNKLSKYDLETYICSECYGRLPGYTDYIMQKPFAEYDNFDDCVSKNQDKDNPEAYCATIMRSVEGKKQI